MTIDVAAPKVQATLFKMVGRRPEGSERYNRASRKFDLTRFLGPGGSIHIQKAVNQPTGSCAMVFNDRIDPSTLDSVSALIEPMDMIEVRGSVRPHLYQGRELPLLMRFFVSEIRHSESAGTAEAPLRTVTVAGEDCGKLLLIHHMWWQVAALQQAEVQYLNVFKMQATAGIDVGYLPVGEFMKQLLQVANLKINKLPPFAPEQVKPFSIASSVTEGRVSPNRVASYDGSIWGLMSQYADMPWNEIWCDDRIPDGGDEPGNEAPVLIFRPSPFRGIDGAMVNPEADSPRGFIISDRYIQTIERSRSDRNVANWFWTPPGASMLEDGFAVSNASLQNGSQFDFEHPNNMPSLYGIKKMEVQSVLLPNEYGGSRPAGGGELVQWHEKRAQMLRAMNRDNVMWEDGTLTMAGDEEARCGREVIVRRGGSSWEAYVPSVSHTIRAMADWTTTLSFVRGTSFNNRIQSGGSVMLQEVGRGPYTRQGAQR